MSGSVHFSAKSVRKHKLAYYPAPALIPPMRHLPAAAPSPPRILGVDGATVRWRAGDAVSYAVYVIDPGATGARLVATVRGERWVDPAPRPGASYCVTGLDRNWNEGPPSAA